MKFIKMNRRWHTALLCAGVFSLSVVITTSSSAQDDAVGFFAAGEFAAGNSAATRETASVEQARRESLQGGSGADFTALIELIQTQTSGPWQEIDQDGGDISEFESGVRVDPHGVLAMSSRKDANGALSALGVRARKADLNQNMAQVANLRLISLTRLEKAVAERIAAGKPIIESMKMLAGISQIEYVFVYPETGEVVIGGPAESWEYNEVGMAVGSESGRPILQLDDLVTVMRTFSDDGMNIFGCSIDPQAKNIKAVKEFAANSQARGPLSPAGVRRWAAQIGEILGLQDITVYGVPANSRVARVLVEADYRMKMIGVGKLDATSQIPDYFDLLKTNSNLASGGLDAMRWWMTMKYDEVLHSEDNNVYQVKGSSVKCQSENQFLNAQGERVNTGQAEPVNRQFAQNFTDHYQELAQQDPIFADLQGVFDLALVAALIQRDELDDKANWDRGVFANNGAYQPEAYATPRQVDSVVAHRVFNGKDVVLQVAGGVRADLMSVLKDDSIVKNAPRLEGVAETAKITGDATSQWWWDAR
ncbi:DUF1598 domain-containing protein [Planctomicrobium sp.]|jgi:hypothetical protein|nr:DUF1598 domain-containing protein [Planctomicrobium sp.]MDB4733545.1 DUF1598 domain-containing protein [Planctomicrobium sp.]MDB4743564.1 DUF1598 domain-containing protein [Planctomicrobium sp.]MDB4793341.1 DUF1598 domain-containing protein [bacterium]MDB4802430.1 DUF1598 domain-containing protein [bacterium]